jgi:predicted MFS family arabinose efflux permease
MPGNGTEIALNSTSAMGNSTAESATAEPLIQTEYPLLMYIFLEIAVLNATMVIAGFLIPEMVVETANTSELEELNETEKEHLKSQSSSEKTEIEKTDKPTTEKASLVSVSLLRNRMDYTMFLASHFFFQGGMIIIFTYLGPLLKSINPNLFNNDRISNMFQVQGVVEIIGKAVIGLFLIDRYPKIPLLLLGYVGISIGYGLLWTIQYFKSFMVPAAYVGFAIGGFADAGMGGLLFAILVEIMNGSENYSVAIGMDSLFCNGVSATLAPLFGGFLVDMATSVGITQPYTFVYLMAVGMLATAFMFSVILKMKLKKAKILNQT